MEGERGLAHPVPARLTAVEGRKFGLTVGIAFFVLSALVAWRGHSTLATAFAVAGGLLVLGGVLIPERLGPVQRGWMAFALAISKVTTPIFMALVYYVVLTPTGILRRMFGRNPLKSPSKGTLWFPRTNADRSDLTRQF